MWVYEGLDDIFHASNQVKRKEREYNKQEEYIGCKHEDRRLYEYDNRHDYEHYHNQSYVYKFKKEQ